mmetsp:Transcript_42900/g.127150  ORF Transcript_42900/g.127150 Transcript_42900/m.127150 type:complete len:276 (-) Transcript_42900:1154-1981(-)
MSAAAARGGAGTASGGGGGRFAGGGACVRCGASCSCSCMLVWRRCGTSRSPRSCCSPQGGTSGRGEPWISSSRARMGRGFRFRRSSASGAATSPRIMAATEAPPVLTPSPRALGGLYACFCGCPPAASPRFTSSNEALTTSSVETPMKRMLPEGSGRHCVSYSSSTSRPPTLEPERAFQMLKPLSTRMRGASTEVRKWRPSGAHSEWTVQFATKLETRTKSHFSSSVRPKKSTWPARFPKPARHTRFPLGLKRTVLRCAFSKSTFATFSSFVPSL